MKILYVFPHPDDESFGPAPAMAAQLRQGEEVYLLTLTRGEATKQRFRLGVDKKEMGQIRFQEMQCVKEVLGLSGMEVCDLPDSGLKELDPKQIETIIDEHIEAIQPDILVTYAVHGISGFEDHLVSHAVVKSVYCDRKRKGKSCPRRLAFFTHYNEMEGEGTFRLTSSKMEDIDCWIEASDEDYQKFYDALDCYKTYQQVIEKSNVKNEVGKRVPFEIFQENFDPPLQDLAEALDS
ncbi:N-acetylglucosaminyl deacetylase, LmbE family [Fodinibius roseus]|uniref:N-acetylglucosaminyl deacetylase, LmbE family n=1 Tax=Fodinibius roseus TaxID=1194090 RepID=A0A1M5C442_9BACT|nr:PIG-L family deacetylase [Fodinibius roseus]SHF49509.1 N-acetylglucosaminyl deacetylase, LmbE family [Fodinibius roseus]